LSGILSRCWRTNSKGSSPVTGILVMLKNKHIRWISNHQKKEETSTYDSELVASRISTELILEVRYMLHSLGGIGCARIDVRRKYVISFEYYSSFKCLEEEI
jgi:hypothetical protein